MWDYYNVKVIKSVVSQKLKDVSFKKIKIPHSFLSKSQTPLLSYIS